MPSGSAPTARGELDLGSDVLSRDRIVHSRLTVSLSAYGGTTLDRSLATLVEAGVKRVQLSVGVRPANHLHALDGFPLEYSVHSNFPLGPGDGNYCLVSGQCMTSFERMFDFCAARGIRMYSFHTGRYDRASMTEDDAYSRFVDNLWRVHERAANRGVTLAVETMYPTRHGARWVLDDERGIRRFLAEDMPVGLVADAAHVKIGASHGTMSPGLFEDLLAHPALCEVHISSNDGVQDTHRPLRPGDACIKSCARVPPGVPVVYEGRMNGWPADRVREHLSGIAGDLAANGAWNEERS